MSAGDWLTVLVLASGLAIWAVPLLASNLLQQAESAGWPVADGELVELSTRVGTRSRRHVELRYRYSAGDREYEGTRYEAFNRGLGEFGPVWSFFEAHAVGDTIMVRYDPDEPSRSLIRAGAGVTDWAIGLGGIGLLCLSPPWAAYRAQRAWRRAASTPSAERAARGPAHGGPSGG